MINDRIRSGVPAGFRMGLAGVVLLPALSMVAAGQSLSTTITNISPNPLDVSGTSAQVTISGSGLASTCAPNTGNSVPPPLVTFGSTNVSAYVLGDSSTAISLNIPTSLLVGYAGTTIQVSVLVYLPIDGCLRSMSNNYQIGRAHV
jgi:hypothetical protein